MSEPFYILYNNDTIFIVIRDLNFDQKDLQKNIEKGKDNLTFVFDFENLSKKLDEGNINNDNNFKEIIYKNRFINKEDNKNENKIITEDNLNLNIVIKNCLVSNRNNLYYEDKNLKLNKLIISDELYSMSPYIDILFQKFKPKSLTLKKFKINSKLQLNNFLKFIINTGCEELNLDDIFVELIIKNENDKDFNTLKEYIFYENGIINIKINGENKKTNLKKIKMVDCPLFVIKKNTFKKINNFKDISINIDENSLVNPSIITKFKINNGYSNICFDLDSYKLNENEELDYTEYIKYIFDILIDENYNYNKIKFKNFDVTKFTFIEEKNWILNKEEKERKERFEKNEEEINKIIENNLDKLLNIKELIFDNCSNHFIKLILKLISKKEELEYLKIKKCGKEYFDLSNILSLKIKNLILFDTPLIILI